MEEFAGKSWAAMLGVLGRCGACTVWGEERWLALPQLPRSGSDPVSALSLRHASWLVNSPSPIKGGGGLGSSALLKGQQGSIWHPVKGQ